MQFKKNRAILAAVVAAAMASSALMSVTASAAGSRKKDEKYGDETYAQRFLSLYDDVVTHGEDNGYLSSKNKGENGGFGVPYHSIEECICEAPDYGHETTSEAMSYIIWIAAMEDNITKNAGVSGVTASSDLAKAWDTLERMVPSNSEQSGFWAKNELSAQVAKEYPEGPENYPSEGDQSNVGKNPLHKYFTSVYSGKGGKGGEYLLHWLADVDDWYGFGGSAEGTKGTFTFINTFQRGDQESCFETIPHPCIENLTFEGKSKGGQAAGMKFAFSSGEVAKQWSYTNAPDAEDRAIQAVFAADRWGVGDTSVSAKAAEMGDECRNNMFDKYYKAISKNTTYTTSQADGQVGAEGGQHYLMSWYTSWGGAADGQWAWQIGCSHSHQFYQNPLAAYGLLTDSAMKMKAQDAEKDYTTSLQRQLEFYQWLQSAEGPFAGGATNSYNGRYETYPSGVGTFYDMVYIEHPVYADPGSNYWTGNQFWATQRLAELFYVIKKDGGANGKAASTIKPGGLSIEDCLEKLLDRWVEFFVTKTEIDENGDFSVPSNLNWTGSPADWTGTYSETSKVHAEVSGMGNTDLGCANSLADALIYYAKAKGVEASGIVKEGTTLPEKALYTAQQLMDRSWNLGRDDKGLSRVDHNGSLARMFAQEVYVPEGAYGIYPYGHKVEHGATFSSIRPMYEGDETYEALKKAYEADVANGAKWSNKYGSSQEEGKKELEGFTNVAQVNLTYHRFWHISDVLMALGTMYELYPDVIPSDQDEPQNDDADWGNVDCSEGATPVDRVTMVDAVMLAKASSGVDVGMTTKGRNNADVVNDGDIKPNDLTLLLKYLAGSVDYSALGQAG